MIEITILAVALSMDSFAVSIGLGTKKNTPNLALKAGFFFGIFQALMLFIGYFGGKGILGWIETYAYWAASGLLILIGAKMIYESFQKGIEEDILVITNKIMLILAIATSIDAMAAGFSLTLLDVSPYVACFIIGIITFTFSVSGVFIGSHSGTWLRSKAEIFGGTILILMGIKILIF
jgi:manganese efflux pump family protein